MNITQKILSIGIKKTLLVYTLYVILILGLTVFFEASTQTLLLVSLILGTTCFIFLFLIILYLKQNEEFKTRLRQSEIELSEKFNLQLKQSGVYINEQLYWHVNQLEASHYLQSFISPRIPLPNTRLGAASPDLLSTIFEKIILKDPKTIVEFGCGVSTLFIGHLLRDRNMRGKIHAVDHSEEYFKITEENISNTDLNNEVSLYLCPLKKYRINDQEWLWYDTSNLTVSAVDLLIIDGPPGHLQAKMRYPAIPLFIDRLTNGALIIVDDYKRYEDSEMVKEWLHEFPQLKLVAELNSEKGTAVLQKR